MQNHKDQTRLDLFLQAQQPAGSILQARKVSDRSISSSSDLESEDCIEIILMTSSYHKKKKIIKMQICLEKIVIFLPKILADRKCHGNFMKHLFWGISDPLSSNLSLVLSKKFAISSYQI